MRDVEYLATLASLYKPEKYSYPKETIDTCWEKVLLNQFHDGQLLCFLCKSLFSD